MIRQIFIAPLKEGVSEENVQQRIKAQLALKSMYRELKALRLENHWGFMEWTMLW